VLLMLARCTIEEMNSTQCFPRKTKKDTRGFEVAGDDFFDVADDREVNKLAPSCSLEIMMKVSPVCGKNGNTF
jgi:hypothetical protein